MNRRNTIKGIAAIGALSVISGELLSGITQKATFHFIGLGGAGTNILTHFLRNGVEGQFTSITCTAREDLRLAGVRFIPFKTNGSDKLSDQVKEIFKGNDQYVLLAGIGGSTGTKLMDELLHWLPEKKYLAICTLPFGFEGPSRQIVSKGFYEKYEGSPRVKFFDMDAFRKVNGGLKMKEVFDKSHEQLLEIFMQGQS
jgi:cell division GTPase FtsZ